MAKGISKELYRGILELEPTAKLEFFILYYDYEENPSEFIPLHAGSNGIEQPIYWQGILYRPFNIQGSAFEFSNDQTLARPHLRISNKSSIVSLLLRKYNNMNGAKVIRKRTLARFLDDVNFPNGDNPYGPENFNAGYPDEKYYISHVINESAEEVEFELITPLELDNQKIPNRKVHSSRCSWVYRGYGCRYSGPPIAYQTDQLFVDMERSSITPAELKLGSLSIFTDTSKFKRGDFGTQQNLGSSDPYFTGGVGLYAKNDAALAYPRVSTSDYAPHALDNQSLYFGGSGIICLATGRPPGATSDRFMYQSGQANMERSVCFWIKPLSGNGTFPTKTGIVYDAGDYQAGLCIAVQQGQFRATIRTSGSSAQSYPTGWEAFSGGSNIWNKWHFVAFTYRMGRPSGSGNVARLYVNSTVVDDGYLDLEVSQANRLLAIPTGAAGLGGMVHSSACFSQDQWNNTASGIDHATNFRGYIDDFRQYNKYISALDIEKIYQGKDVTTLSQTNLNNRGEWQSTGTYNLGDAAYIEGKKYKIFSDQTKDGFKGIKFYFLCMASGITTDPRNDSVNWMKDSCSKSLRGCSARFGSVLPFGGYPGTHRYPYSARSNGY